MDEASGDVALGELDAALEKYERCVELDPNSFDTWHGLGMIRMKLGKIPEAIEAGCALLVGATRAAIVREVSRLTQDSAAWTRMARAGNPFGDGTASAQIVAALRQGLVTAPAAQPVAA